MLRARPHSTPRRPSRTRRSRSPTSRRRTTSRRRGRHRGPTTSRGPRGHGSPSPIAPRTASSPGRPRPRSGHAAFEPAAGPRSGRDHPRPGSRPAAGSPAAPPRPDGRLVVRVLSRSAGRDGARPVDDADQPDHGPGQRRRAPLEFRPVCVARADPRVRLRTISTRRCPGRGSGTSNGSRRASSSHRGPTGSRRRGRTVGHGHGRRLPRADGRATRGCGCSRSGTTGRPPTTSRGS